MRTFPSDCSIMSLSTFVITSFVFGLSCPWQKERNRYCYRKALFFRESQAERQLRVSRAIPSVALIVSKGISVADIRIAQWTELNKGAVTFFGMHVNNSSLPISRNSGVSRSGSDNSFYLLKISGNLTGILPLSGCCIFS